MKIITKIIILGLLSSFAMAQSNEDCLDCHGEKDLSMIRDDSTEVSLYVDEDHLSNSVHEDMDCTDCHTVPAAHLDEEFDEPVEKVNCADCHEDEQDEYKNSIHALQDGYEGLHTAKCVDCHGTHNILAADDTASTIYPTNLATTCGECHSKPEVMRRIGFRRNLDPIESYRNSVHGKALAADPEGDAPTCTECHGSHDILAVMDGKAKLNKHNISATCGQCHDDEETAYEESIHWASIKRGHYEAPTCTNCHGEHNIQVTSDAQSPTNRVLQATKLCAGCHSSPTLMENFGLDPRRFESYMKSYHGLAVLKGDPNAATCTSCHETHAIRSKVDKECSVNEANLVQTCSKCHKKVTPRFAKIEMHPIDMHSRNPIAYFFKNLYLWLIVIVIGGMFLHNFIILLYFIRRKRKEEKQGRMVQRFQPFEVYQHVLMALSFTILAITGFALKFPEAGWVQLLHNIGMTEVIRGTIHRTAAVIMGSISIIQLYYLVFTKKGRRDVMALMPTLEDITAVVQNIKFHLYLTDKKPLQGRFDYAEKAEYLALIWGVAVMGATGLILWFPEFFMRFLPVWIFETSQVIHYYEAWLATLAILVWHWFFVIYHPELYPINLTFLDGKTTEENLKHHHPLEYDELLEKQKRESVKD